MRSIVLISLLLSAACAGKSPIDLSKLPPIIIQIPPSEPSPKPENASPPVVEPSPPEEPLTPPEPEKAPLVNLNIVVHDAVGIGINAAECSISGDTESGKPETRVADGGGFINFPVRGSVNAACTAPGYLARAAELPPGDHRFPLAAVAPPPKSSTPESPCGGATNRNGVSHACLESVAVTSSHYAICQVTGSIEACHHYVREVVLALKTQSGNPRWGLLKKTKGGDNVDGYGTDVVAFLPERFSLDAITWQWLGVDIIGGIGAPGARFVAGNFNPVVSCNDPTRDPDKWCNREGDVWAPLP